MINRAFDRCWIEQQLRTIDFSAMNNDYNNSVAKAIKIWKRPLTPLEKDNLGQLVFDAKHKGVTSVSVSTELLGILLMGYSIRPKRKHD